MSLITLQNAQLAFGHVALLDHAEFSLETAERVGLIGRNGAGKSSLLRILGGLEKPDDGDLRVQQGLRVTYVAQEPQLDSNASVFESVSAGLARVIHLIDQYSAGEGDLTAMQNEIELFDGWNWEQRVQETLHRLHLVPDARQGHEPPVRAGPALRDAHTPARRTLTLVTAIPDELDEHAPVLVDVDPETMNLDTESDATKKLYGLDQKETEPFGRQLIVARRLAERVRGPHVLVALAELERPRRARRRAAGADEGVVDHKSTGGRETKDVASNNHPSDVGCGEAADRGKDEDRQRNQQRATTAECVNQRANEKLPRSHAEQARGDGQLNHCVGGVHEEH